MKFITIYSFSRRKNAPKSQSIIARSRDNTLPVRRTSQVQYSVGMSVKSRNFLKIITFPNSDLIHRKPVCRDYFIWIPGKVHIANLTPCIYRLCTLHFISVPKLQTFVSCTPTCSQNVVLMRWPRKSFYCCHMITKSSYFFLHF